MDFVGLVHRHSRFVTWVVYRHLDNNEPPIQHQMAHKVDCNIRHDVVADLALSHWGEMDTGLRRHRCDRRNGLGPRLSTGKVSYCPKVSKKNIIHTVGCPANLSVEANGPMGMSKGLCGRSSSW